jgi:hypothetical protein
MFFQSMGEKIQDNEQIAFQCVVSREHKMSIKQFPSLPLKMDDTEVELSAFQPVQCLSRDCETNPSNCVITSMGL